MVDVRPNRCYGFSLYLSEDEKQWLRLLAEKEGVSMAEEVRLLIIDEKNRVIEKMNKKYRK